MEFLALALVIGAVVVCCGLPLLLGGIAAGQKDHRNASGPPELTLQDQNGANLGQREKTGRVEAHDSDRHNKHTRVRTSL